MSAMSLSSRSATASSLRRMAWPAGAVALVVSAGLVAHASVLRWWRVCGFGPVETELCTRRQNDHYDVLPPTDGWIPIDGAAASVAGAAASTAAGWLIILLALRTGRRTQVLGLIGMVSPLAVAAAAWQADRGGATAPGQAAWLGLMAAGAATVAWLIAVLMLERLTWLMRIRLVAAVMGIGAFGVAAQLLTYVAFSVVHASYDSPPWVELGTSLIQLAAAGVIIATLLMARRSSEAA